MNRKFECYICDSIDGKELFSIKDYPAYILPLPEEIAPTVARGDLPLYICNNCGHMQVPEPNEEIQKLIYETYYNFYVVDSSEALIPHYREPFINFITELVITQKLNKGNILEIGCSSGEKVEFFAKGSKKYTGIDPSDKIRTAASKFPQHTFIQGYFPDAIPDEKFDTIITQFNLEHIGDVQNFITNIYKACNENGVLIIQVPDCENFLRTGQPNFLAHEHIQYFTKETLLILLQKIGFKVFAWGEEGASLIAAALKDKPQEINLTNARENINKAYAQAKLFNESPELSKEPVIFYGVGPQLYWLLNKYKGNLGECEIIDDNPNYHFQGLPGSSNKIKPLSREIIRSNNYVVLSLNKIYHEKVLSKLKALDEPCTVLLLKDNAWTTIQL